MDYNTSRNKLVLPEYGRNIQKLVEQAIAIENQEERNNAALAIIRIMGNIHPHLRDVSEFTHKLWDHLHLLADYKLEIDSPYPLPEVDKYTRPKRIEYPQGKISYRHFGKVIESLIKLAVDETDEEKKYNLTKVIVRQMRKTYATGSREGINDETIYSAISHLSENKLEINDKLKEEMQKSSNSHQRNRSNTGGLSKRKRTIRRK